jgi:hypothetical protein
MGFTAELQRDAFDGGSLDEVQNDMSREEGRGDLAA